MRKLSLPVSLALLAAAALPIGCQSGPAVTGAQVAVTNPISMINLGANTGGSILIGLNTPQAGFQTKANLAKAATDITFYQVALIKDQGSAAAADYSNATLSSLGNTLSTIFLDGPSATVVGGVVADAGNNGKFGFTNVPAGTYRIRVLAFGDAVTPGSTPISKPDAFFTNSAGWAIAQNTASIVNGTAGTTYTAPDITQLVVNVNLNDANGDNVNSAITVFPGGAGPAVGSQDL